MVVLIGSTHNNGQNRKHTQQQEYAKHCDDIYHRIYSIYKLNNVQTNRIKYVV